MCLHFTITGNVQFFPPLTVTLSLPLLGPNVSYSQRWTTLPLSRTSQDLVPEEPSLRVSFRDDWVILPTTVEVSDYHGYL